MQPQHQDPHTAQYAAGTVWPAVDGNWGAPAAPAWQPDPHAPFQIHPAPPPLTSAPGGAIPGPATKRKLSVGRLVLVLVGCGLLAVAITNFVGNVDSSKKSDLTRQAGGAAEVDPLTGEPVDEIGSDVGAGTDAAGSATSGDSAIDTSPTVPTMGPAKNAKGSGAGDARPKTGSTPTKRSKRAKQRTRVAGAAAVPVAGAGRANAAARAAGAGEEALPYTGASHWIVFVFGTILVCGGIALQMRAHDVAYAAQNYQRGPLLRPLDAGRDLLADLREGNRGPAALRGIIRGATQLLSAPPQQSAYVGRRYGR